VPDCAHPASLLGGVHSFALDLVVVEAPLEGLAVGEQQQSVPLLLVVPELT